MVRRREYHRRSSQGTADRQVQKSPQEQVPNRESAQVQSRESTHNRNSYYRENAARQNCLIQNLSPRHSRIKEVETVEDIKEDIARIEKEIQLELKEIRSLKLGL